MKHSELQVLIGQGVLQQQPDQALWQDELAELENSGFLRSLSEKNAFAFSNNLTWEVVYETLLFAERRRLHKLVARHIEKHNGENLETVAAILLHHYETAQVHDKCVLYGAMAGDRAGSMYANEDALDFYRRALAGLDAHGGSRVADRSLLYERMGDVYETAGRHQESIDALTQAIDLWCGPGKGRKPRLVPWVFRPSTREAELCRKIAVSCERQSDYDRSLEWLDRALEKLPPRPGRAAAQICASRSITLFRKGEYQEGIQWGQRALRLARRSGQLADVAYAHTMLASSHAETGHLRKAIGHLEQAVELYEGLDDFPGIAAANSNLASYYGITGQIESSIRHFDVALEADERMHNASSIAIDHQNLGHVLAIRGWLDEAILHLEKVVAMDEKGECRPDLAGAAYIDLCQCRLEKGQYETAQALLDKGLSLLKRSGQTGLIMDAELQSAELKLAANAPKQAYDLCVDVLERIRRLDAKLYEVRAERVLGNSLDALGETEQAINHLKNSVKIAARAGADHEKAKSLVSLARVNLENAAETPAASLRKLQQAIELFSDMGAELELAAARQLYQRFHTPG